MGNFFQDFVTHLTQSLFVVGEGVVECELVSVETEVFAPLDGFLKFPGHGNQLFDNLSGFDGTVLVALYDVCEKFGEFLLLDNVGDKTSFYFSCKQSLSGES